MRTIGKTVIVPRMLALRILIGALAICALGLIFTEPYIPVEYKQTARTVGCICYIMAFVVVAIALVVALRRTVTVKHVQFTSDESN